MVGYQITTASAVAPARLAVDPPLQGNGISSSWCDALHLANGLRRIMNTG
jgi:hypothetical protein